MSISNGDKSMLKETPCFISCRGVSTVSQEHEGGRGGCSPEMIIRYVPRFGDLDFTPVLSIIIQLVS